MKSRVHSGTLKPSISIHRVLIEKDSRDSRDSLYSARMSYKSFSTLFLIALYRDKAIERVYVYTCARVRVFNILRAYAYATSSSKPENAKTSF